ncbi:hypothetical protein MBANPS3_007036 [Mucor bainieri]
MHTAASPVINAFVYKEVQLSKTIQLLQKVVAQGDRTLTPTNKLIKKYLALLNEHQASSFSLVSLKEAKKDLIDIYNNTRAPFLTIMMIVLIKGQVEEFGEENAEKKRLKGQIE